MAWRDLLSYKTFRVVRIRDTRLGLLHWGLLFMIFAYIVGHNFLQLQKYQKVHSPVGSIRTTLKLPEERYIEKSPHYCGSGRYEAFGQTYGASLHRRRFVTLCVGTRGRSATTTATNSLYFLVSRCSRCWRRRMSSRGTKFGRPAAPPPPSPTAPGG